MIITAQRPLLRTSLRPHYWNVDSDFKNALEAIDNVFHGTRLNTHEDVFSETDKAFLLTVDLPGVIKSNIDLEVEDNILTIKSKRTSLFNKDEEGHQEKEQKFRLPKGIDADGIQARSEDGVLYLAFPKLEEAKPKKITVGTLDDNLLPE